MPQKDEIVEAEIIKNADGKKARQKAKNRRKFYDVTAPILTDVFLAILGISLLIWADLITDFLSILIGVMFALYGVSITISFFKAAESDRRSSLLLSGAALIAIGIFLCFQTSFIKDAISFVIGFFIILISISKLNDALKLRAYGPDYQLPMLFSVIGLAAGILCIVGKIMIPNIFIQILGIMLLIFASTNIINNLMLNKIKK